MTSYRRSYELAGSVSSSGQRGGDEDTVALAAKGKKKKVNRKVPRSGTRRKRELSSNNVT